MISILKKQLTILCIESDGWFLPRIKSGRALMAIVWLPGTLICHGISKHLKRAILQRYLSAFVKYRVQLVKLMKGGEKSTHCTSLYPVQHRPKALRVFWYERAFSRKAERSRLKLFQLSPGQCQPLPHFKHIVRAKSKPIKAHSTQEDLLWPVECTVCGKHLCQRDRC